MARSMVKVAPDSGSGVPNAGAIASAVYEHVKRAQLDALLAHARKQKEILHVRLDDG